MQYWRRVLFLRVPLLLLLLSSLVLLVPGAFAAGPVIKVVSPAPGSVVGYPTYFEAYSYSTTCKAGISAMRLYESPGKALLTPASSHITAFVGISPGSYTTTVVAWDNCGGSSAVNIPITVSANPGIVVYQPTSATAGGPLHVVAGAHTTTCAKDIYAMRVYTAPGVAPYSVLGNQLDAFLTLAPGSYNIVVQAWDNCGNVLKSSFRETVSSSVSDKFLYSSGNTPPNFYNSDLIVFPLNKGSIGSASGVLTNTRATTGLQQILVDPSGYFLYATDGKKIFVYNINRNDGTLQRNVNSPYNVETSATQSISIALDPNGHFLYVSDPVQKTLSLYRIYRSDGTLYYSEQLPAPGGNVVMNSTGSLLFETSYLSDAKIQEVSGFFVDQSTGLLMAAVSYNVYPGPITGIFPPTIAWKYLYLPQRTGCCGFQTFAYEIVPGGGLNPVPGSPFVSANNYAVIGTPVADWLTRYYWYPGMSLSNQPMMQTSDIDGNTGELGENIPTPTANPLYEYLAEDHSGQFLYTAGSANQASSCPGATCEDVFASWTFGPNGQLVRLSGPVTSGFSSTISETIAVATSR